MTKNTDDAKTTDKRELSGFINDVVMMIVVIANLLFIAFDWQFEFDFFRRFVQDVSPGFFAYYRDEIHPNFLLYDFVFVAIFLSEFVISWIVATLRSKYTRWWYYPFIHWYDLVGCIPLSTFRALRVFRVISMMIRLHKMSFIDLKDNVIYREARGVYQGFVDQVTDRVLINIVSGIQRGVAEEHVQDSGDNTLAEAVRPDQEALAEVVAERIQRTAANNYLELKSDLREHVEEVVRRGFEQSTELESVRQVPLVGEQAVAKLERSLTDVTYNLIDSVFQKAMADDTGDLLKRSVYVTIESMLAEEEAQVMAHRDKQVERIARSVVDRVLERIKRDIKDKGFKERAGITV